MTITRKVKREIPYEHGGNTVRAWTGHRSVPPVIVTRKYKGVIPYEHGGSTLRAWIGHRSVLPVTGTNIQSCVCTILCLYDLLFVRYCICTILCLYDLVVIIIF